MNKLLAFFTYFFFTLCALSFLGFLVPAFDSLSVFRPITWLIAAFGTYALSQYPQAAMRLVLMLMFVPFFIMFDQSQDFDNPALRIYQHNLLYTNVAPDLQMVVDRRKPDVLTLQEIFKARDTIENLEGYPYQNYCSFMLEGDVGVFSRFPILDSGCAMGDIRGFAWARINKNGQEVTVVSLHLRWPWPYSQAQQLEEILPQLKELPQPIVMAGDLNQVLWSQTRRELEKATNTPALHGLRFTLVRSPIFLPIDQAFGHGTYNVRRLERYGSDHNALLIDFQSWPNPPEDAN